MLAFQVSVFETVIGGVALAAILGMWAMVCKFIKEQRKANAANRMFIRSMQRAEIVRYFRIVVEQGNPITPSEMEHIDSCYASYHDNGGNGTGTIMYEKIKEHVRIITTATMEGGNANG